MPSCIRCRGVSTVTSLNRKAFCLLAGLPDIWMRMQTSRITEFLVNLNTRYCLCGKSTVARFCSAMGFEARYADRAIEALENKETLYTRQGHRITSTLQYMKKMNLGLINKFPGD